MFADAILVLILLSVWLGFYQLLKQQGRILLRLDALERASAAPEAGEPEGLEIGAGFPPFSLPDLSGNPMGLQQFCGKQVLLVHWNPGCGFCDLIAPDLARVQSELERQGVQLLLLAYGDADANRKMLEEHGLACPVLLYGDAKVPAPLENLGTPSAYLLDREGRVEKPLAVGSEKVPALAREIVHEGSRKAGLPGEKPLSASRIERSGLKAGTRAPHFTLRTIYGRMVSLDEYLGRRVLLMFSDPHCGPCDEAARELARFHRRHGDDLALLMIGRGDAEENRRKAEEHGIDFPVVVQEKWRVSKDYGIFSAPVAFLIDEEGVIVRDVAIGPNAILELAQEAIQTPKDSSYELCNR
jgi:peroxiredoxin